jgi:hypothetical protein
MIYKVKFYEGLRSTKLFTTLAQKQVDSIDSILNECEKQGVTDLRQIAYIFATAYWECYNPKTPETRLTPMVEFGSEKYLKSKKYYPYIGRGFSQLTWQENYKKEGKRLGIDLFTHPELILGIQTAANSHVYCMVHGSYTGKKLSDYINAEKCDFINARRIINGTNRAEEIMSFAQKFLTCLEQKIPPVI